MWIKFTRDTAHDKLPLRTHITDYATNMEISSSKTLPRGMKWNLGLESRPCFTGYWKTKDGKGNEENKSPSLLSVVHHWKRENSVELQALHHFLSVLIHVLCSLRQLWEQVTFRVDDGSKSTWVRTPQCFGVKYPMVPLHYSKRRMLTTL